MALIFGPEKISESHLIRETVLHFQRLSGPEPLIKTWHLSSNLDPSSLWSTSFPDERGQPMHSSTTFY